LREALAHGRFVAYQPTSLQVVNGRVTRLIRRVSARSTILRPRFDSLVTYEACTARRTSRPSRRR